MKKVIPALPDKLTVELVWNELKLTKPKLVPHKKVINAAFDNIIAVAGKSIEDIVLSLIKGESDYTKSPKNLGTSAKEYTYDRITECKKGLFPGYKMPFNTKYCEIARIYYHQRFIMEHGLPPYVEGEINMPEIAAVKRTKTKVQQECPNCGFLLSGKG